MEGPTSFLLRSLSFYINRHSYSWDTIISKFDKISKVKVMSALKVHGHMVGPTSYRLTSLSFHVNRPFHSWETPISKFDPENPRSGSYSESDILSTKIPFVPCQSIIPLLRYGYFKIWLWKSKVKVKVQCHIVGPTSYWLISPSFQINWPSYFCDWAISKFDLENPWSRS